MLQYFHDRAQRKTIFIGIKGLIQNEKGEILLLKADVANHRMNTEEYWDIPGGRIEHGYDEMQTLAKELEEVTGLALPNGCTLLDTVFSNHEIPLYEGGMAGLVLRIWRVPITGEVKVKLSFEHTEYDWFTPSTAAEHLAQIPARILRSNSKNRYCPLSITGIH